MPTPAISDVFGQIVSAAQVEDAVALTLQKWFPTYLLELERQYGFPKYTLPAPKNYMNRANIVGLKGEELPKVLVLSQGTTGEPSMYQRSYCAIWRIGVAVAIAASPEERSNRYVKAYGAAVRAILAQNPSLGWPEGLDMYDDNDVITPVNGTPFVPINVARVTWVAENYTDIMVDNQLALYKSASIHFDVEVNNVMEKWGGPSVPSLDVPEDHIVEEVVLNANIEDSTQPDFIYTNTEEDQ